jgi:hypothetical protein
VCLLRDLAPHEERGTQTIKHHQRGSDGSFLRSDAPHLRNVATPDRPSREPAKCNITSLAEYQKVSTSGISTMRSSEKGNRTDLLLLV